MSRDRPPPQPVKCTQCGNVCEHTLANDFCRECGVVPDYYATKCVRCCPTMHGQPGYRTTRNIDLRERVDVLQDKRHVLTSRLLSVETPVAVRLHADMLEQRARELLEQAQRIRDALEYDTSVRSELQRELDATDYEIYICRYMMQQNIKCKSKMYLANVVEKFMRSLEDNSNDVATANGTNKPDE